MGITDEWPEYGPDLELKVDIRGGIATLISPSKLKNKAEFDPAAPNIVGSVFKNGAFETAISIHVATGNLDFEDEVSVSTNDVLELRFVGQLQLSEPWISRLVVQRSAFMTVASGDSTTTFNSTTNAMPIPAMNLCFGWDASEDFKVGVKVLSKDSASQDLTLSTRLLDCPNEATTKTIDLDNTSTAQTHVADFGRADSPGWAIALKAHLASGTSNPKQEDTWTLLFWNRDTIPDYDTDFPTAGTNLQQTKVVSGFKLNKA